jgi:signal transduction histidine kinase
MKTPGGFTKFALFLVAYLAACLWGARWATGAGAALWPPDAVLLIALLVDRPTRWWWYVIAGLPIRWFAVGSGPEWLFWSSYINDCLKALLSAYLLRRTLSDPPWLNTLRDFMVLVLIGALLSPVVSATVGAGTRAFFGDPFGLVWLHWFLGDSLAIVTLVPAFLFGVQARFRRPLVSALELATLALAVLVSAWLAFWSADQAGSYTPILLYTPIPALVWATVRSGPAGVSISMAFIVLFALACADVGHGPFIAYGHAVNRLAVQMFLMVLALPLTTLALLMDERQKALQQLAWNQRELQAQNVQLRMLAGRLITAYEDERQRISRDLHDDIGQRLSLIALSLDRVDHSGLSAKGGDGLPDIRRDIHELARDLHGLSRELYSSTVHQLGLGPAIQNWCSQVASQYRMAIEFIEHGHNGLPRDVSMCLYRVAQEALNNAVKHGRARHVTVQLERDSFKVRLRVVDSGDGFDPGLPTAGIGLASMRERLRFIGGDLSVISAPGRGAEVTAEVPVN